MLGSLGRACCPVVLPTPRSIQHEGFLSPLFLATPEVGLARHCVFKGSKSFSSIVSSFA